MSFLSTLPPVVALLDDIDSRDKKTNSQVQQLMALRQAHASVLDDIDERDRKITSLENQNLALREVLEDRLRVQAGTILADREVSEERLRAQSERISKLEKEAIAKDKERKDLKRRLENLKTIWKPIVDEVNALG